MLTPNTMRITRLVIYAAFFMVWSRETAQSKPDANQMSAVNVERDMHMGFTLDMSPNSSINPEPYAKVEKLRSHSESPTVIINKTKKKKKKEKRHKGKTENDYNNNTRYIYFPGDGDYKMHKIDIIEPMQLEKIDDKKVTYWLYTRKNPTTGQLLKKKDKKSVSDSNLNVRKDTVFLSHGWKGDRDTPANKLLTEAFLHNGDVNVIRIDWSYYSSTFWYPSPAGYAPDIGTKFGKFIHWLNRSFGLSLNKVHLVGFSLGAHVVGNAGRELGGMAKRITGLDPAGPQWRGSPARLYKTDARYVEVIHTNGGAGKFGYWGPLGHSDHYPNGGYSQPNCSRIPVYRNICNHYRAYELMAATVKLNHLHANECGSMRDVEADECKGKLHPMGNADIKKRQ